jgi:hypothetical protein
MDLDLEGSGPDGLGPGVYGILHGSLLGKCAVTWMWFLTMGGVKRHMSTESFNDVSARSAMRRQGWHRHGKAWRI